MCSKCCCSCSCCCKGCCKNYSVMIAPRLVPSREISGNCYGGDRAWQHHSIYREYWAQYNHLLVHFDKLINPFSQPKLYSCFCSEEKPAKRSGFGYPVRKDAFEQAARSRAIEKPKKRNSHSSKKRSHHEENKKRLEMVRKVHKPELIDWKTRQEIELMCQMEFEAHAGPSEEEIMEYLRECEEYEQGTKIHARKPDQERMEELYGKENAMKIIEMLNAENQAFQDCQNKDFVLWPVIPLKF